MSKRTILHVEGIGWKTTLKDLITCFQYAKNIQLKVTRPLDPDNLRVMLEFDSEKSYRLDELEDKISKGSCEIEEKKVKKVDKSPEEASLLQEFEEFIAKKIEVKQEKEEICRSQSIDSLISRTRETVDRQGHNQGEYPVPLNGNFHPEDVRRFCKVCNVELNAMSNYNSHRNGKKHQKRQWEFNRTGKFAPEIQMAIAKQDTLWHRYQRSKGLVPPQNSHKPMEKELRAVINNQPLEGMCPLCNIKLSSPTVTLQHYSGQKHQKAANQARVNNLPNVEDIVSRIHSLVAELRQVKSESPNEAVFNDKFKRRRMMSKRNSFERNNRENANREQSVDWVKIEKEREDSIKAENKKIEKIKNEKESKKEAERQKEIEARKRKEEEDMKIKRINDELSRKRKLPARQAPSVAIEGRNNQSRAFARIFHEPNPTGESEDGEVIEAEAIVDLGEEEVIGSFHSKLDTLYKQNNNAQ